MKFTKIVFAMVLLLHFNDATFAQKIWAGEDFQNDHSESIR